MREQKQDNMARILLVEDNEMNRDMLSRRLERKGHQVVIATDGEQALDLVAAEKSDLILMDMSLPVSDGWEATRFKWRRTALMRSACSVPMRLTSTATCN